MVMNKKNKQTKIGFYGWVIAFVILFLASAIIFRVYNIEILPSQFFGALIGVFITAIVTAFLLRGQTKGDEEREKSLKVFETQKEKYNNFINEIWKIWDKRSVRLEDVNALLKMVSQDIVLYTKPATVNEILSHLTQIAEYANLNESDNTDESSKKIQEYIFSIINALAKEINLGGKINDDVREKLNSLEDKLLPYINRKKYIKKLDELVRSKIECLQKFEFIHDETSSERNILRWLIGKGMWLRVGDQWGNGELYFAFWSEFYENRQYQEYRYRVKGDDKGWMKVYSHVKNFAKDNKYMLNFNDFRDGKPLSSDTLENLAKYIEEFFATKYEEFGNKDIIGLIEECNK